MVSDPRLHKYIAALGISEESLKSRQLLAFEEATELVVAEVSPTGREHLLTQAAAMAWQTLKDAAANEGVHVIIVSAFRSVDRQADIVRHKLDSGLTIEEILSVSAPPGFSEHHTGRAVDIATVDSPALETAFAQTPAYAWLQAHAGEFGFFLTYPEGNRFGYQYEPWHWCFDDRTKGAQV